MDPSEVYEESYEEATGRPAEQIGEAELRDLDEDFKDSDED